MELSGTEIVPNSSAKLPSQVIQVELMDEMKYNDNNNNNVNQQTTESNIK